MKHTAMVLLATRWPTFFIFAPISGYILPVWAYPILLFIILFALFDWISRYREYKKSKELLKKNTNIRLLAKRASNSLCQRHALLAASYHFGLSKECRKVFKEEGVKFWHVLPRGFTIKTLFTSTFWKSFFIK